MYKTDFVVFDGVEVPVSVLLRPEHHNRYGTVKDLPEEELVDPDELERVNLMEALQPILRLPVRGRKCSITPSIDEDGRVDWGAFATADFDEYRPDIDKPRYKSNILEEEKEDALLTIDMLKERIQKKGKYRVMRKVLYLARKGKIEIDQICDWDIWQLAKYCVRVTRLNKEIRELRERSRRAKQDKVDAFWQSMG
jgi:hypothetical protein